MRLIRNQLNKLAPLFEKNGKLERLHPLYEAVDSFLYTPGYRTRGGPHIRDQIDLKRIMILVVVALFPCFLMAWYNTGYQAHLLIAQGAAPLQNWQESAYQSLGLGYSPHDILACFVHGVIYFLPIWLMTLIAGSFWEVLFAIVRKHEITEGFLVTSSLIPLILPATIPLWQVFLATSFGVVIAKEVFGGVGMNILNPALCARAFLFFAYPGQISGDHIWTVADVTQVDGLSGATWLARVSQDGTASLSHLSWWDAFIGLIPGSMGETSTLCCLLGALFLIITRIASWRTMFGVVLGTTLVVLTLNTFASTTNPMFHLNLAWHMVLGGWAFGTVYMATDPVSSAFTNTGKLVYGFAIGALAIIVRAINPAYPEGMMLAILFMNMFAPLIDHFVIKANIRRRATRYAA